VGRGGFGCGFGGCCDWGGWSYDFGYLLDYYRVPYFAACPPVYYSYPVPRTYGYSPFAYPPGIMTPDPLAAEDCAPIEITNPYVPSSKQDQPKSTDKTASQAKHHVEPLVIDNPYVSTKVAIARAEN
jgi:hypothetical protein